MKELKLYTETCFKYLGKIYYGQIVNIVGHKFKEYKIISWIGEFWFAGWIKENDILQDRRTLNKRRKKDRRKKLNNIKNDNEKV